jgi:uracil-DNA glycosylase family 4
MKEFEDLSRRVLACRACERMKDSLRILGHSSGPLSAKLMFIGEAPGRLGADRSAIPFHGDRAGDNFERLLEQVGLSRYDVFVTNAVLCNPKDDRGNNATPNRSELKNCSGFLRAQIELVEPDLVVTLGSQALSALEMIESHNLQLAASVRTATKWFNRLLIPAYHPGQRAMIHRSFLNQLADYQFIAETYRRMTRVKRRKSVAPTTASVAGIVQEVLFQFSELSYFKLHKLFFLIEFEYFKRFGYRLTSAYMVRQKDGPYVFELNLQRLRKSLPSLSVTSKSGKLMLQLTSPSDLFERSLIPVPDSERTFPAEVRELIDEVLNKYGSKPDSQLKTAVYLTYPMRRILRRERTKRENLFNFPITFDLPPNQISKPTTD